MVYLFNSVKHFLRCVIEVNHKVVIENCRKKRKEKKKRELVRYAVTKCKKYPGPFRIN
jgi:hypothetical protein